MKIELCRAKKCEREVDIKMHGLCHAHYVRYWRTGMISDKPIRTRKTLEVYKSKKGK